MNWAQVVDYALGIGGSAVGIAGLFKLYDAIAWRIRDGKVFKVSLDGKRQRQALRSMMEIAPDAHGRSPWVLKYDGSIMNPGTGARFDENWIATNLSPLWQKVEMLERLALASPSRSAETAQDLLPEANVSNLPTQIGLMEALGMHTPSLDSLLVGVTLDETGKLVNIYRSIYQLMHLFSVGSTGTGKSSWMLSFLAQLNMCKQAMEIVLIDVHGAAFNVCQDWSSLRYPVARNNQEAKLVLQEVINESERRAELFQGVPLAKDLATYNANVEQDQELVPWVTVIDEGTLMLSDSSISHYVGQCVQGTRQYGLYIFMTGQSGNASVVKSEIRGNFPTRVCYNTEKAMMAAALGESPPGPLPDIPGRAWARLLGRQEPHMIQSAYVRHDEFYRMLDHNGPRFSMPEASKSDSSPEWNDEYLWMVWDGLSTRNQSELCKALWLDAGKDPDKVSGAPGGSWSRDVRNAALRADLPIKTRK